MNRTAVPRLLRAVAAIVLLGAAQGQAQETPRVRLIATGGTIANRDGGRLTHQELVRSIPGLERYARAESEQFANVASSQLTLAQWLRLARRINELFARDRGLAGVVVTSGTDTLEETAYFLNLTVRDERPVVMAGAMRSPDAPGSDGAANLLAAFRVAADPASRNRGVLVVLNDEINAAREVTKTDTLRLHTFQTRGYGVLGVVDGDRVVYYRDPLKRHTSASEFDVGAMPVLPRVDIVMVYQGAPGDLIKAAVDRGAKGIVIASAGAGAATRPQQEAIRYAASRDVFVAISTRTGSGRIPVSRTGVRRANRDDEDPAAEALRRFVLGSEDLAPLKARVLLMVALTKTRDPSEIRRMFTEY